MSLPLCQKIHLTWKDVCGVPLCFLRIFFMTITRHQYDYHSKVGYQFGMAQSIGPRLGAYQFLSRWRHRHVIMSSCCELCYHEPLLAVVATKPGDLGYTILNFPFSSKWFSGRLVVFGRWVLWFLGIAAKQFPTWTAGPRPGLPRDNRPSSNCISRFLGVCTGKAMDESGFNHPGSSLQLVIDSSAV